MRLSSPYQLNWGVLLFLTPLELAFGLPLYFYKSPLLPPAKPGVIMLQKKAAAKDGRILCGLWKVLPYNLPCRPTNNLPTQSAVCCRRMQRKGGCVADIIKLGTFERLNAARTTKRQNALRPLTLVKTDRWCKRLHCTRAECREYYAKHF